MRKFLKSPYVYIPSLVLVTTVAFLFLRKAFWPDFTLPVATLVVAVTGIYLFIIMPLSMVVLSIVGMIQKLRNRPQSSRRWFKRTLPMLSVGAGAVAVMLVVSVVSEFSKYSTPLVGTERVSGGESVAEWQPVEINGMNQWISVRGVNKDNPVILFVTGGPGISRVHSAQHHLRDLEDNYTVVTWDQPGSGKTYVDSGSSPDITEQTYIDDMNQLAEHLKQRFDQDKIYVVAESWGTIVATLAIAAEPDHYAAYFGTGQMVDMAESQAESYQKALEAAREDNDERTVKALEAAGEPPYSTEGFSNALTYLNYINALMAENSAIDDPQIGVFNDVVIPELSINDQLGAFMAISDVAARVTPMVYDDDLRVEADQLTVPYYIFQGRHDINASNRLVEDYYQRLDAPDKRLVWFEKSGHTPWTSESDRFNSLVHEYITRLQTN